jgi:hypothetical protein
VLFVNKVFDRQEASGSEQIPGREASHSMHGTAGHRRHDIADDTVSARWKYPVETPGKSSRGTKTLHPDQLLQRSTGENVSLDNGRSLAIAHP